MSTALSITLDELMGAHPNIKMERIDFTIDEVYRVATFLFYDESIANGSKGTVIGVHGGPAFCHNYILPLKLLVNYGYRVILYDQCGCGLSSNVNDVREHAPHLLTIEYYCRELNALISHYGLEDFHLYGSSWGTMVIQEFAVMDSSERSGHLLSIMLDGALCDSHLYIHTQWRDRISTLPTCTQSLLRRLTDEGDFRSELYKLFDDTMSCMFMCRTIPKPEAYYESVRGANMEIYEAMQGASEFTTGGVLKDWSITSRLHRVAVPVLCLAGEFDTMTVECHEEILRSVTLAAPLAVIPRASHCKLMEEPLLCVDECARFLASVAEGHFSR